MLKRIKKLKADDLEELRKREELIKQHTLIAEALEYQKQIFISQLFSRYGLDGSKQFNINLKTGRVSEEINHKK